MGSSTRKRFRRMSRALIFCVQSKAWGRMSTSRPALRLRASKTAAQLRDEIEADAPVAAGGDSPEREWAAAMAHYVKEKIPKATANGFVRYRTNWLIVYDNWPLPAVNYTRAASHLAPILMDLGAFTVFDAIFVHGDSQMCEFRGAPIIHALVKPGAALTCHRHQARGDRFRFPEGPLPH